jgi:hypothetical protein
MKQIPIALQTQDLETLLLHLDIPNLVEGQTYQVEPHITLQVVTTRRRKSMTNEEVIINFLIGTSSQIVGGVLANYIWEKISQHGKNSISIGNSPDYQDLTRKPDIDLALVEWEEV